MMRTIEAETMTETTDITRAESAPVATVSNYEPVRFNAMKHGILSRLAVLAHEDHAEFDDLLAALIDEHRPAGMTERHLIEELATIIWRKRRVLQAEAASINRNLTGLVSSGANSAIHAAVPFEKGLAGQSDDIRRAMLFSEDRVAEDLEGAEQELSALWKAQSIIHRKGADGYSGARRALGHESRECWDAHIAEVDLQPDAASLDEFLRDILEPIISCRVKKARNQAAIKAQVSGEGFQAHRLEPLSRYETHLDRKFERTLAMLLKLKDLRGA